MLHLFLLAPRKRSGTHNAEFNELHLLKCLLLIPAVKRSLTIVTKHAVYSVSIDSASMSSPFCATISLLDFF